MLSKLAQDRRGNVAILFGIAAPVLAGATAIAVDYSESSRLRASLSATADAAALAGARELDGESKASEAAAKAQAARFVAEKHPKAEQVILASVSDGKVTVDLSVERELFFGGILNMRSMAVSTHAVAVNGKGPIPCMVALGEDEPIGINLIGSAKVSASKCTVASYSKSANSIYMQGAAKISGSKVCAAGGTGHANTSPPPETCTTSVDPYATKPLRPDTSRSNRSVESGQSSYTGPCDYTNRRLDAKDKGVTILTPGIYCGGLSIHSADVVLKPGLYVMQDGPLSMQGNATLEGLGASILLAGVNAILDMQGSPKLTLDAMQTGSLAGIAIASDTPGAPLTSILQGSPDLVVNGSIYLPNQRLEMQGSPLLSMLGMSDSLMALSFRLQGSPDIKISSDSSTMGTVPANVWLIE